MHVIHSARVLCRWELGCCQPPPPPPPWATAFSTPPRLFAWSFGGLAQAMFVLLRVALSVAWFAVLLWQVVDAAGTSNWGVYLTNWSLVWQVIYFFFAALTTSVAVFKKQPCSGCKTTPWYAWLAWSMHMTAVVIPVLVAIFFWILVYDGCPKGDVSATPATEDDCSPTPVTYGTVNIHGINAFVAVLDWCVHTHYYPPWDLSFPVSFGSSYLIFSLLYQRQTDFVIYKALDWTEPSRAATLGLVVVLVAIPAVYLLFAWLDFLFKQRKLFKICGCLLQYLFCCKPWCAGPEPDDVEKGEPVDMQCQTDGNPKAFPELPSKRESMRSTRLSTRSTRLSAAEARAAVERASARLSARDSQSMSARDSQRNSARLSRASAGA